MGANAKADDISLASLGYFGIIGRANPGNETRSFQKTGYEHELLYMFGDNVGLALGVVKGIKPSGHSRGDNVSGSYYTSKYLFNGIKAGFWAKESDIGAAGQVLFTYGSGKFDFRENESTEITLNSKVLEVEGRAKFPIIKYAGANLDIYGGMRMYRILVPDFEYNGVRFKRYDISDWNTLFITLGFGVSY